MLHAINGDELMNDALRNDVQSLRGGMVGAAERHHLPDRFQVIQDVDAPRMIIKDTETGRSTIVPLFAYGNVREALNDLFG
jgi:hypothetical protein